VPAMFHTRVANACIATGRNMVTASYISPEMAKLDARLAVTIFP
jgi:saccharopine dehydrogenase-like NADP-dependent oxidoreductase